MRDDRERLADIQEAIERIERYAARGKAVFEADELVQSWMVQHLQIIGEACRGLSQAFKDAHAEIAWAQIVAMRNVLVHGYFAIDTDIVWAAIERDVPELKAKIAALLRLPAGPP